MSARESVYLEHGVRQRQAICEGLVLRTQELAWKARSLPSLHACALAFCSEALSGRPGSEAVHLKFERVGLTFIEIKLAFVRIHC